MLAAITTLLLYLPVASVVIEHVSVDSTGNIHFEDLDDDIQQQEQEVFQNVPLSTEMEQEWKNTFQSGYTAFASIATAHSASKDAFARSKFVLDKVETYSNLKPICPCTNWKKLGNLGKEGNRKKFCMDEGECKGMPSQPSWKSQDDYGCGLGGIIATEDYEVPCIYMDTVGDAIPASQKSAWPRIYAEAGEGDLLDACDAGGSLRQVFDDMHSSVIALQQEMAEAELQLAKYFPNWMSFAGFGGDKVWPEVLISKNQEKEECKPDFSGILKPSISLESTVECFESLVTFIRDKWKTGQMVALNEKAIAAMADFEIQGNKLLGIYENYYETDDTLHVCACTRYQDSLNVDDLKFANGTHKHELMCILEKDASGERECELPNMKASMKSNQMLVNWRCNSNHRPCFTGQPVTGTVIQRPTCIDTVLETQYVNFETFKVLVNIYKDKVQARLDALNFLWENWENMGCAPAPPPPDFTVQTTPAATTPAATTTTEEKWPPKSTNDLQTCDCRTQNNNTRATNGRGNADAVTHFMSQNEAASGDVSLRERWPRTGDRGCMQSAKTNKDLSNRQCRKICDEGECMGTKGATSNVCPSDYIECEFKENAKGRVYHICPKYPDGSTWCPKYVMDSANADTNVPR